MTELAYARGVIDRIASGQHRRALSATFPLLRHLFEHSLRRRSLLLACPHRCVMAMPGQQVEMAAALDYLAAVEHQDLVGIDDGGEPVGDDEGGAVLRDLAQARLDLALGLRLERPGPLV